ncbi:hypothetical protein GCM10011297_10690 [Bacterioplanes sanyensis]|uniref:hypothetical protein n=1 Tax=Bacterioplanes sanyensis TaxID=1249553 RepID=UPI00167AEFD5|nr:hypothetical protein [Bacterioplanes sanyensis]GGY39349.1 hypothetical protein GCM10011297_10690 [Bacterioplanes sanyensis]
MSQDLFERIKLLSLEVQSLVRQGVKDGVPERIDERNALLRQWFAEVNDLMTLTNEQQQFLEQLLQQEQQLLTQLEQEQHELSSHERGKKKVSAYQSISRN